MIEVVGTHDGMPTQSSMMPGMAAGMAVIIMAKTTETSFRNIRLPMLLFAKDGIISPKLFECKIFLFLMCYPNKVGARAKKCCGYYRLNNLFG
jgi:hypothetical protein